MRRQWRVIRIVFEEWPEEMDIEQLEKHAGVESVNAKMNAIVT